MNMPLRNNRKRPPVGPQRNRRTKTRPNDSEECERPMTGFLSLLTEQQEAYLLGADHDHQLGDRSFLAAQKQR